MDTVKESVWRKCILNDTNQDFHPTFVDVRCDTTYMFLTIGIDMTAELWNRSRV